MRKSQCKNGVVRFGAFEDERSCVLFGGAHRNRETEPGTGDVLRIRSAIKAIENMSAIVATDTGAAVVYADEYVGMLVFDGHDYGLPGAVLDRVLDEIDDRLMKFGRVGNDPVRLPRMAFRASTCAFGLLSPSSQMMMAS